MTRNRENFEFLGKFTPKGTLPLSDFYKILHWEGVTGPHTSAKYNHFSFKNAGLQPAPKIAKIGIVW